MKRAWQSVYAFLVLMFIVLLVFALVGEELLAGKLGGREFRFHYDNLVWALITTFQVCTVSSSVQQYMGLLMYPTIYGAPDVSSNIWGS
jgi:hypothetical protein